MDVDINVDIDAATHSQRPRSRARSGEEPRKADDGRVGITALSPTDWLVCDLTIANGDPSALLGFIQLVGDSYEVTHLGRVNDPSNYSSFNRAAASLAREAFTSAPSPDVANPQRGAWEHSPSALSSSALSSSVANK